MFRRISLSDAPKRSRRVVSKFERTEEWRQMKAALDRGLNPQEALEVVLTEEDKEKYDLHHRRTVSRFIKGYLRVHEMPYTVKSFDRDEGTFYLVMNERPTSTRSRAS